MSDVSVTVGGGTGVTVAVNGNTTTATVTAGGSVQVTLTDTSPPAWSGITGKPTTFPPQAHNHFIGDTVGLQAALDEKADLDSGGKVPASQLPSYVDDVLEVANAAALPATGETGKIYVTLDNGKVFRWSGSVYVEISAAPGSTDFVPEGTSNLYHTTARAAAAAPVQSVAGKTGTVTLAKADVGLGNVDNTSDANKPVSTATQTALDGKAASSHTHGNVTSDGKIGTTSGQIVVTGTGGALTTAATVSSGQVQSLASGNYLDPGIGSVQTVTDALQELDSQIEAINYNLKPIATSGSASDLTAGTVPIARIPTGTTSSTVCIGNDSRLSDARTPTSHVHAAADITSGTIATARLGSGTADSTTFLRGDSTFATPPVTSVDGATGAVTLTKCEIFDFTMSSKPAAATGSGGSYTFAIPNCRLVRIIAIGGGSGGGSGRRGAASTLRGGGGGGGGAQVRVGDFLRSEAYTTSLAITIGAGGAGGAGVTSDNTDGNAGTRGGDTRVQWSGTPQAGSTYSGNALMPFFNVLNKGAGGGGTSAAGGTAGTTSGFEGPIFSIPSPSAGGNGTGNVTESGPLLSPGSGAGGGGISAADATQSGGRTVIPNTYSDGNNAAAGGAAGGGNGTNRGTNISLFGVLAGCGGSGGGSSTNSAGGSGGNGAWPGGGGGGGGASLNGFASGAGGNGADGLVRIMCWS